MKKPILIKITLLLLFVFNIFNCQKKATSLGYQNDELIQELGIGLIQVVNPNEKIILYSDSNLSKIKVKNSKIGANFIPILNKPDYNILFFVCVEKKSNFYKIVISKNNYVYIKPSRNLIYYNWENFLKEQVISVKSKDLKNNPICDSINGKAINTKSWKSDDEIEIIKVQNNWLQIKNITQSNSNILDRMEK